jgi:hypothetical protein
MRSESFANAALDSYHHTAAQEAAHIAKVLEAPKIVRVYKKKSFIQRLLGL